LILREERLKKGDALLAPRIQHGNDGSQQQVQSEASEVTLLLKPVPQEALPQEQQHILEQYSEELFSAPHEQPAADTDGTEPAPQPVTPAVIPSRMHIARATFKVWAFSVRCFGEAKWPMNG
ncbi:hypothetical protein KIL84_011330, partial [Mauremys mutica]